MATDLNLQVQGIKDEYKYGFHDSDANYSFKSGKGLTRDIVDQISEMKNEPDWMRRAPPQGARRLLVQAFAPLGRRAPRAELRRHQATS